MRWILLICPVSFMISNSVNYIICFISYHLSVSDIHNAYFLHSNYNLQMFNNSHFINHQLFFFWSHFLCQVDIWYHLISYFLLLLVSHFKSPKLLSSCHLTFSFIPVNTLLPLIISEFIITSLSGIYPQKLIQKFLFPHSILWSSGYFVPDCNLPLSHYWNSDGLCLSFVYALILFNFP